MWNIIKLIIKNTLRHTLRALLTIAGVAIAVMSFGLLRTVVASWNSGVEASAANRLITRQAVSFIFTLPYSYAEKVRKIDGVESVSWFNWFGGVYIDKNQFFARMATDPETLLDVYPEFLLSEQELADFKRERNACVIGTELAKRYNLSVGDVMDITGDIYPGNWQFVVRGIYKPRDKSVDATQMFFQWEYLNERIKSMDATRANEIGWLAVKIADPKKSAQVSESVDALFKNSRAETKTETERAFQQGFVAASSAIITAINVISYVIIGIILLVIGNTMIMSARERTREYAVLKSLGFSGKHLIMFICGEALLISLIGAGLGLLMLLPMVSSFEAVIPKGFFPVFNIEKLTYAVSGASAIIIGLLASIIPIQRALTTKIVDGLRFMG